MGEGHTNTRTTSPAFDVIFNRGYKAWGSTPLTSVWMRRLPDDMDAISFTHTSDLGPVLDEYLQRQAQRGYSDMGCRKFKTATQEADFEHAVMQEALTSVSRHAWGEVGTDMHLAAFRDIPQEPTVPKLRLDDKELTGCEVEVNIDASPAEVHQDMLNWKAEGQTWWSAWLPDTQVRLKNYFEKTATANRTAAKRAAARRNPKLRNCSDLRAKFPRIEGFSLSQSTLRPAARGRVWTWQSGRCQEMIYQPITNDVKFNTQHIQEVADLLGFLDQRVIQMLIETGMTHGTEGFPMTSQFYPNSQGASQNHDDVTPMILDKINKNHFAMGPTGKCLMTTPDTTPAIQVPLNGNVAKPKEREYYREQAGEDFKWNVRGTFNGSSPHDGESPNDYCPLSPELNKPWTTIAHAVWALSILDTAGSPIQMWKTDFKPSYMQCAHQLTQAMLTGARPI